MEQFIDYTLVIQSGLGIQPFVNENRAKPGHLEASQLGLAKRYAELLKRDGVKDRDGFTELGGILYDLLVKPVESSFLSLDVWPKVISSNGSALLRFRVIFQQDVPADIASLPWEFLFCPDGSTFLATDPRVAFSLGYDDWLANPYLSDPVSDLPMRLLFAYVRPPDLAGIATSPVQEALEALHDLEVRFDEPLEDPTVELLQSALINHRPHVFHLLTHGTFERQGRIALSTGHNRPARWYDDESFSDLFRGWKPKLIVLQVCAGAQATTQGEISGVASWLVQRHVPAVVAMRYPFSQRNGWRFVREFYQALAAREPLDRAVQAGRLVLADTAEGLQSHAARDFGCPVLWMRLKDGCIFPPPAVEEYQTDRIAIPHSLDRFGKSDLQEVYLQRVAEEHRYLYTEAVDRTRVELRDVFNMLEVVEIHREDTTLDFSSGPLVLSGQLDTYTRSTSTPQSMDGALRHHTHLVILGEPGSGKSTVLQFLALAFAVNDSVAEQFGARGTVPVLASLRTYDGATLLVDFIVDWLGRVGQFDFTSTEHTREIARSLARDWLYSSRLAILLDGLDEVPIDNRQAVVDSIARFAATPEGQKCRIIVASRIDGYNEVRGLGQSFGHFILQPFIDDQHILSYVRAWLHALKPMPDPDEPLREAERLLDKVREYPDLKRVSGNPLLLRLAIALWKEIGDLGKNRTELYRRYIDEVMVKREQKRRLSTVPWTRKQIDMAMRRIAWELHMKKELTLRDLIDAVEAIDGITDGTALMSYLRERLGFLSSYGYRRGELVGFRHQTFQEYFVAQELAPLLLDGTAPTMKITDEIRSFTTDLLGEVAPETQTSYDIQIPEGIVYIPPGPAILGEGEDLRVENIPYGYFVDRFPVTNESYATFVKATGHKPPKHWKGNEPTSDIADHPVVYVTWYDAVAYARWVGKRLLSESEWEKAARGSDGRLFPWGNEFDPQLCNSRESGIYRTTSVGNFSPVGDSFYGCADMAGNVAEWTASEFRKGGKARVLKGGSFSYVHQYTRCANRVGYHPALTHNYFGFRLAHGGDAGNLASGAGIAAIESQEKVITGLIDVDVLARAILENRAELIEIDEETRHLLHEKLLSVAGNLHSFATSSVRVPEGMVYVPAGQFIMGGTGIGNEAIRIEQLDYPFFCDKYPVTNRRYREFLLWIQKFDDHTYCHPDEPKDKEHAPEANFSVPQYSLPPDYFTNPEYDDYPVVNVDWWDAYAYTRWAGKRLPTEREWEKAARGIDGRRYPYGDALDISKCNVLLSGINSTNEVTHFGNGVSPFGCYDMIGNVWEWCLDRFDPEDSSEDTIKVVRGGSFGSEGEKLLCAYRNGRLPTDRWVSRGFRCVTSIDYQDLRR